MAIAAGILMTGLTACSGTTEDDTEPKPTTPQSGPASESAEAAGCPDAVFTTFSDLEGIAQSDVAAMEASFAITLPAEPACVITWVSEGEQAFTAWWTEDAPAVAGQLKSVLVDAGFTVVVNPNNVQEFVTPQGRRGGLGLRSLESKLGKPFGANVAVLYG